MKRPPGLWMLLSAGVLWLSLQDVCGIRATSLIFGKSSTSTSTDASVDGSSPDEAVTEQSTEATSNVTKPTLTGIPQLDYIWDPNLPQELNGYNLSDYPFYERVPEDIDFKCDGLHDGFYASVPHKCQVYHHCLFGTRYDFLCANYTAFDQKTFICHFVSEVDCVHSKKYWHRNDALYQAASTTTVKPIVISTSPPLPPQSAPSASIPQNPRRPPGSRRRPLRRPQYEYYDYEQDDYDDYYEERYRPEGRRRKRPLRPRQRPVYDDEYEDYEEERYERRGGGRRNEERNRKNYNRRGSNDKRYDSRRVNERRRNNNNKDRRKHEDIDEEDEDYKLADEESPRFDKRKINGRNDDKRTNERKIPKRRPQIDEEPEDTDRRRDRAKPRRPIVDDYEDDLPLNDKIETTTSSKFTIKPTSGSSIYDRPRVAPRIKPPVPKSEANKFAYKSTAPLVKPVTLDDEEYYDDYEEEEPIPKQSKIHRKTESSIDSRRSIKPVGREETTRATPKRSRYKPQPSREDFYDEPRSRYRPRKRVKDQKQPTTEEDYYEDDYEDEADKKGSKNKESEDKVVITTTTQPSTTTARDFSKERGDNIVRIVKRPFLPSRGGNPYVSRGLQPVGAKALDKKPEPPQNNSQSKDTEKMEKPAVENQSDDDEDLSGVAVKAASPQKSSTPSPIEETSRPQFRQHFKSKDSNGPRTTQKPKVEEKDPLDLIENEYDVTLNDALNPTLPNLPIRSFPTGFSASNTDYTYIQRPRYVIDPVLTSASSDYAYQTKPAASVRQRFEPVSFNGHAQQNGAQYGSVSGQNYRQNRPPQIQTYYTSY